MWKSSYCQVALEWGTPSPCVSYCPNTFWLEIFAEYLIAAQIESLQQFVHDAVAAVAEAALPYFWSHGVAVLRIWCSEMELAFAALK